MITTDVELMRSLCREWQERLGLLHWRIKVEIKRRFDMRPDRVGTCDWTLTTLQAIIKLLHPTDFDPAVDDDIDMEQILVHELLHLHFAPFDESGGREMTARGISQEQAIESIAWALVNLKHSQELNRHGASSKGLLPLSQKFIEQILENLGIDEYHIEEGVIELSRKDFLKVAAEIGFNCVESIASCQELGWTWKVREGEM